MEFYSVGTKEFGIASDNFRDMGAYHWLVYCYDANPEYHHEGGGQAVAYRKDEMFVVLNLGHNSVDGPLSDTYGAQNYAEINATEYTREEFFAKQESIFGEEIVEPIMAKVKELLGITQPDQNEGR